MTWRSKTNLEGMRKFTFHSAGQKSGHSKSSHHCSTDCAHEVATQWLWWTSPLLPYIGVTLLRDVIIRACKQKPADFEHEFTFECYMDVRHHISKLCSVATLIWLCFIPFHDNGLNESSARTVKSGIGVSRFHVHLTVMLQLQLYTVEEIISHSHMSIIRDEYDSLFTLAATHKIQAWK